MVAGILIALVVAGLSVVLHLMLTTRRIAARAERNVPAHGSFVEIDGNRIHYIEQGEGLPILMIHGLGGTLHHMRRPLMEEFGEGYRLIAMDRPGSGYSTRARGETGGLPEQAHFVHRFIEALGLDRPLLVGHSLGGTVALATALHFPQDVAGLALISPATHHDDEPPEDFRRLAIRSPLRRRIVSHTIAIPMSVRNAPRTLDFVFGPQQAPDDFAVAGGAMAGLRPSHFYATSTDLVALEDELHRQETRYGEIRVPTGIIFGDADRVADFDKHGKSMVGKISDLELEILHGVGHMPQYSHTERVAAFIRRVAERAFAGRA